jgi:hypothetical protein
VKADEDLFALEFGPVSEMSSFLSWEIMHLQTISDSVRDLKEMISMFEYKPIASLRPLLEKLLPPKTKKPQNFE